MGDFLSVGPCAVALVLDWRDGERVKERDIYQIHLYLGPRYENTLVVLYSNMIGWAGTYQGES